MVLQVRLYLTQMPISGTAFGIPLRLGLTASSSPTEAIPTPSSFSLTNPGGGGTLPIMPTSCLGNHRVNPFNKLTLMKMPYKKYRNNWTTAGPRRRKQQPGNAQAQCYSTKQPACPSKLAIYGNIMEKPALRQDHPQNSGPHYCFYEKLKCLTARAVYWVNISEIPDGKCPE